MKRALLLVNVNVNVICLPTEHQGVHRTRSEMSVHSRIELEFEKCWFLSNWPSITHHSQQWHGKNLTYQFKILSYTRRYHPNYKVGKIKLDKLLLPSFGSSLYIFSLTLLFSLSSSSSPSSKIKSASIFPIFVPVR